jgi:hypothetical protein
VLVAPWGVSGASAASGAAGAARALGPRDIDIDLSPAQQQLALWKQVPAPRAKARQLAGTLPIRTLRYFFREQFTCQATDAQVVLAISRPDSGICGFGLDPPYQRRVEVAAIVEEVQQRKAALTNQMAESAARYLPWAQAWKPIRVWFVIASQATFDAVTLQTSVAGDSIPVIFVNLTEVLPYGTTAVERVDVLSHILAHEVFHAGLREAAPRLSGWTGYRGQPRSAYDYITSVMLDEGVAHYVDWRDRPGSDTLFTWKQSARESHAFSQLALACKRLRERRGSPENLTEVLQLAAEGPLWSKYGAISGMFAAFRIEMALGLGALREAVEAGPKEFLRVYGEVAARNPALSALPWELTNRR